MAKPSIPSSELVRRLQGLPPKALLRRSTWQQLLAPEDAGQALPAIGLSGRPGRTANLSDGSVSLRLEEPFAWPDLPLLGFSEQDGQRVWRIPPWVHYSPRTGEPRLATVGAAAVMRGAELVTALDQVPGLVGFMQPNLDWANQAPPSWVPVSEENPGEDYPDDVTVAAPRLLATINLGAVAVYARRPFEFVQF